MHRVAVRIVLLACVLSVAFAPGDAHAQSSCGAFKTVGTATIRVGQLGSYNVVAGSATFTATMSWGDGTSSSASVSPASPSATLTHLYRMQGQYAVNLTVTGHLSDGTPCSNAVFIANVTVVANTPSPSVPPPQQPPTSPPPPAAPQPPASRPPSLGPDGLPLGPLPSRPPFVGPHQAPCPPNCSSSMPIGGYDPTNVAAPSRAQPFTKRTWHEEFKRRKAEQRKNISRIDKAGTAIGSACGLSVFLASLVSPEPFSKGAIAGCAALVAAMKGWAAVSDLWLDFADPFDPDYRTVAQPQLTAGPHAPSPPFPPARARALNALSDNFVHSRDVLLALMTAINRAQSAGLRGDHAARSAQLHALARFARQMGALVGRRPRLRRQAARALKGVKPLSARRVRKAALTVRRRGVSGDLAMSLAAFGVPRQWVTGPLQRDISHVRARLDLAGVLLVPAAMKSERQLAASFRSLARNVR
jgi:hypothetical protein